MTLVTLIVLAASLMAGCCWMSNLWPGTTSWPRALMSRLLWWGLPFGLVVWINGAPLDHAAELTLSAWLGAFVPHVPFPQTPAPAERVAGDSALLLLRVMGVLIPPAAVFALCGAFWPAMGLAAGFSPACVYAATVVTLRMPGLRDEREIWGVIFGAWVGICLALAVWVPTPSPDLLP